MPPRIRMMPPSTAANMPVRLAAAQSFSVLVWPPRLANDGQHAFLSANEKPARLSRPMSGRAVPLVLLGKGGELRLDLGIGQACEFWGARGDYTDLRGPGGDSGNGMW
eukprot:CAMPEP_0179890044 /NCGR_PEP_ID=MMETSP0982-20121206/32892_1 /TAXON_ID=483367 /ORGANISM="non described non described, Strain CCMP 2436" /LENGTH=107 /DNA_ID=CAMNT_0021786241 /DNA_START=185 /DNA_END=507 /DNA_ORIENTATION=+